MTMNRWTVRSVLLGTLVAFAGCGDDDLTSAQQETLALAFQGLEALTNGFHYEGWAIINGAAVSTGKFNVDGSGNLVDLNGAAIANGEFATGTDLSGTGAIVLTIEPAGDTDAIPADTHILAGDVASLSANLTAGAAQALGADHTTATGSFILATPTDVATDNENSGIWFLDNSSGSAVAGLSLPTLPAGWVFEGWAVINGTPVSTGTFTSVTGADAAAPFSGPNAGPPFPGEDFLVNAPAGLTFPTDLAGGMAVISIEPSPDDSAAPFTLKPLAGAIDAAATSGAVFTVSNNTVASFPTGTATIR